jgi:3-oxoacyl-[acyl-carrier protein] reductase
MEMRMDLGLAGKAALVTGSGRGMGKATALCLAAEGANLVINDLRNADLGEEIAASIRSMGRDAIAIRADVGDPAQVAAMFSEVERHFGKLDVLVNNAGIGGDSTLMAASPDEWNEMLRVNLTGPFPARPPLACSKSRVPGGSSASPPRRRSWARPAPTTPPRRQE